MRCYFKNRLQKLLLPLLVTVPTITQYIISNILLRFSRMFSKFAGRAQLCDICKNMRIVFNLGSIQTGCLSAFLASFANVFKICCFDLALVSAMR